MHSRSILLTGGSGFLGSALLRHLARTEAFTIVAALRPTHQVFSSNVRTFPIDNLSATTQWASAFEVPIDVVIHAAARVHVMSEVAADPLAEFRKVNVEGTLNLARQAAASGVSRFMFISSIKVNGENTDSGLAFKADDIAEPSDPYGVSKLEAEVGLRALAAETGMEVVIIRPVLVYGPGVKANFLSMMRWLDRGFPLPLGSINNKRSLVSLDNLIDLIATCMDHPNAANQTFLVSDGDDVSTPDLLRRLGRAMGKPARLLSVPRWMMEAGAAVLGKSAMVQRLFGSLQVDISKNYELLGWRPVVAMDDALRATAKNFLESQKR
ncbi:UDP-glucose 4-epimerase family protein [Pseudomonas chlororaphis]|uniref:UDP-glucose 4-epimerase family protein n=1 Tax=Pseudomonas chlororaphis TaxID=587753 RepID=UPI0018E937B9|nr:SDR family oxidoreductase [Pseudomonas chlororaphis]